MPEINDTAPDFTLPRDGGGEVSLSDLRGSKVVLFFYPKDDTPGCTKESIGFSADAAAYEREALLLAAVGRIEEIAGDMMSGIEVVDGADGALVSRLRIAANGDQGEDNVNAIDNSLRVN